MQTFGDEVGSQTKSINDSKAIEFGGGTTIEKVKIVCENLQEAGTARSYFM